MSIQTIPEIDVRVADAPTDDSPVTRERPAVHDDVRPRSGSRLGLRRPIPFSLAAGPVLLVTLWVVGSATGFIDRRMISTPWSVLTTGADLIAQGKLQDHFVVSARRALLGLAIGIVVGTVLALVSGLSRIGESVLDGPIQLKRAIPSLALLPLLILWLGIGETMKITTITLGVFVPIYLHTHNGLRAIDSRYVELAETVGITRREFVQHVVLPGALPGFLLGLRFAVTGAWLSLVVVEQINSTKGIGYMMELARTYGQTEIIFVGLLVYGTLGLGSDRLVRYVQRRSLSWRRTMED